MYRNVFLFNNNNNCVPRNVMHDSSKVINIIIIKKFDRKFTFFMRLLRSIFNKISSNP